MTDAGRPEFTFSLALSHDSSFEPMLADLAAAVLRHLGYEAGDVTDLVGVLQNAMAKAIANGGRDCRVAFAAHDGQLYMGLRFDDGIEWRTSRRLP